MNLKGFLQDIFVDVKKTDTGTGISRFNGSPVAAEAVSSLKMMVLEPGFETRQPQAGNNVARIIARILLSGATHA